jgi:DNA-directed RNA polymerase subunit RPC12/RpoP
LTATIIKKMSCESDNKKIYHDRLLLLLHFFSDKVECLIDGLKTINMTTTVASIVDKIMADMPSFITTSECTNNFCSNQRYDYNSIKFSVSKYNEKYSIQNELDDYTKDNEKECTYCGCLRISKSRPTTHILIEINYVPLGK